MRKISQTNHKIASRVLYCVFCDEAFENDVNANRAYCEKHPAIEMSHISSVEEYERLKSEGKIGKIYGYELFTGEKEVSIA